MSDFNYASLAAKVVQLIQRFGAPGVLRKVVDGAPPDATQPWIVSAPTNQDTNVKAVFEDLPSTQGNQTEAKVGDKRAWLAAAALGGVVPAKGFLLIMASETWEVMHAVPVQPGPVLLLWDLVVMKWPRPS